MIIKLINNQPNIKNNYEKITMIQLIMIQLIVSK
jgi:hypothetical protein